MKYRPEPLTSRDPAAILEWAVREFERLGDVINVKLDTQIEFLAVAPAKPREGLTVGADGTNWDPGSGKGIYTYYDSAWNKLG